MTDEILEAIREEYRHDDRSRMGEVLTALSEARVERDTWKDIANEARKATQKMHRRAQRAERWWEATRAAFAENTDLLKSWTSESVAEAVSRDAKPKGRMAALAWTAGHYLGRYREEVVAHAETKASALSELGHG